MLLLASGVENNNENTLVESEGEKENMKTESVMHENVFTGTLSKCEQFYLNIVFSAIN